MQGNVWMLNEPGSFTYRVRNLASKILKKPQDPGRKLASQEYPWRLPYGEGDHACACGWDPSSVIKYLGPGDQQALGWSRLVRHFPSGRI